MGVCCNTANSKGEPELLSHEIYSMPVSSIGKGNKNNDIAGSLNSDQKDVKNMSLSINVKQKSHHSLSLSRSIDKSINYTLKSNFSDKLQEIKKKAMNSIKDELREQSIQLKIRPIKVTSFDSQNSQNEEIKEMNEERFESDNIPSKLNLGIQIEDEEMKQELEEFLEIEEKERKERRARESKTEENLTKIIMKISPDIFIQLKKGSIQDNYKLGDALGEGTYGKVQIVTHIATGMIRAMKTIRKNSLLYEEEQKIFAEMTILKSLDHPNIIKLYELYKDEKSYYLITEYCSGGELFLRIKTLNHFSEKKAADYIKQILSAIVYCHSQNIVHRDLKPENLLFASKAENASLKVIDFGTARKFDKKKMSKRLGTPYYIAPEVLNQSYNEKCDVWSCGVILYIMLCGYPPFGGKTEEEIFQKIKRGKVIFDPMEWGQVSQEGKNLVMKMLKYDPDKRISSAEALQDPWIHTNAKVQPMNQKIMENLRRFSVQNHIKKAILTFMATQVINNRDREELLEAFRALDLDGDGIVTKDELRKGYQLVYGESKLKDAEIQNILEEADNNYSGKIDFSEFCVAAINREKVLSRKRIIQTFKILDEVQFLIYSG